MTGMRLQRIYQLFTDSPNERIPSTRLVEVLRFAGYIVSEEYVQELARSLGDTFDFEQLLRVCEKVKQHEVTREELEEAFKRLTADGSSYIDAGRLTKILSSGEDRFEEDEIEELLSILSPDGDGRICYDLVIKSIFAC